MHMPPTCGMRLLERVRPARGCLAATRAQTHTSTSRACGPHWLGRRLLRIGGGSLGLAGDAPPVCGSVHARTRLLRHVPEHARACLLVRAQAGSETSWLGSWLTRIGEESAGPRAICAARLHCPAATPPSVQCRCVRRCVGFARLAKPTQRAPSPLLPALAGSQGLHQLGVGLRLRLLGHVRLPCPCVRVLGLARRGRLVGSL